MSMIGNFLAVEQAELDALYAAPGTITDFLYETHAEDGIDVDKAWHGIHFLLTEGSDGSDSPLARAILGGAPIGDEDVGYGPARGLASIEVREIAAALEPISEAEFRARYDSTGLNEAEIYPQIWDESDALDYLVDYFLALQQFYQDAAERSQAVILFIN